MNKLIYKKYERECDFITEIILYSTGCPKCKVLINKLESSGIEYTINNSIKEMGELGISTVPVLSIDGVLYEFSEANNWINGR